MKSLPALLAALASTCAMATPPTAGSAVAVDVMLQPKKIHEECARLEPGQGRRYHWKSSAPVDFNIHYHRGKDVHFPVKRDAMRGDGGTFTARTTEDYCWMWTARDAPAKVEGGIEK